MLTRFASQLIVLKNKVQSPPGCQRLCTLFLKTFHNIQQMVIGLYRKLKFHITHCRLPSSATQSAFPVKAFYPVSTIHILKRKLYHQQAQNSKMVFIKGKPYLPPDKVKTFPRFHQKLL